jgi:hypothetical protein
MHVGPSTVIAIGIYEAVITDHNALYNPLESGCWLEFLVEFQLKISDQFLFAKKITFERIQMNRPLGQSPQIG